MKTTMELTPEQRYDIVLYRIECAEKHSVKNAKA